MAKEILLYGSIDSYSANYFIDNLNEILDENPTADISLRLNTPGGDVQYAWGAIAKFAEIKNKKIINVDGKAHSMGLYFCCYAENVTALDVSEFCLHRAAYPSWIENDPEYFDTGMKAQLDRMNKKLRAAFEGKVDVAKFEKLKGVTLDQVFSMEGRLDVFLTGPEAKKIGLINSLTTITPTKKAEIESLMFEATAKTNGFNIAAKTTENKKQNIMDITTLKTDHPAVYAAVIALGIEQGISKEKSRAEVWAHYSDVDAKVVKEGIASGKEISQLQIIELTEKKFNPLAKKDVEEDNTKEVKTTEVKTDKTEKEIQAEAFMAEVNKNRILNK